jgi:hypothetical protein
VGFFSFVLSKTSITLTKFSENILTPTKSDKFTIKAFKVGSDEII